MIFVTRRLVVTRIVLGKASVVSHTTCGPYRNSHGTEPGYEYIVRANDMSHKRYSIAVYTVPIARSHIYFRNAVAKLSRGFLARDVFQNAIIPTAAVCDAVYVFYLAHPFGRDIVIIITIQSDFSNVNIHFLKRY